MRGIQCGLHLTDDTTVSFPMIHIRKVGEGRWSFKQNKILLKWHLKFKNVPEVQRWWTYEFETTPPTQLTIKRIQDELETYSTVNDV